MNKWSDVAFDKPTTNVAHKYKPTTNVAHKYNQRLHYSA